MEAAEDGVCDTSEVMCCWEVVFALLVVEAEANNSLSLDELRDMKDREEVSLFLNTSRLLVALVVITRSLLLLREESSMP